jgi:hypothetical protein
LAEPMDLVQLPLHPQHSRVGHTTTRPSREGLKPHPEGERPERTERGEGLVRSAARAETPWGGVRVNERAGFDEKAGQDGKEKVRESQSGEEGRTAAL